jgi:glutamate N-acetyltransferase/amino-acid N-acetyltransferase
MEPLAKGLPIAYQELSEIGWADAAQAILTTDTVPKGVSEIIHVGDQTLRLTGIAKGAGMIHPNMATMLAYIGTDAKVPKHVLQAVLEQAVKTSFNRITVDGDTSTNDACVLMASGRGELVIEDTDSPGFAPFLKAVMAITRDLAQAIIRDAEGATKFITIEVEQAGNEQEAEQVAFTIANSPLVKTAFFGKDANWGRILAAIGRAGLPNLDIAKVTIWLDEYKIVSNGARDPDYIEDMGQIVMDRPDITLRVSLDRGNQSARVWTSDLSHDYVSINADYRT